MSARDVHMSNIERRLQSASSPALQAELRRQLDDLWKVMVE